jgi:hypothetical protein
MESASYGASPVSSIGYRRKSVTETDGSDRRPASEWRIGHCPCPVPARRRARVSYPRRMRLAGTSRYCAVQPPSMTSSLPVTNEASSEAR